MSKEQRNNPPDWLLLQKRIRDEVAQLDERDRAWLEMRLETIGEIQLELDSLFVKAGGASACADCVGECCGCGRHHITLTNLLAYAVAGEVPPAPDFTKTCPYLGETGCVLPVSCRPYNCITFFCEQLEGTLCGEDQQKLRDLDRRLRTEYQAVAERYPAASLRGLWIAMERIGDGQILISNR